MLHGYWGMHHSTGAYRVLNVTRKGRDLGNAVTVKVIILIIAIVIMQLGTLVSTAEIIATSP